MHQACRPIYSALWATPGADTWRGPSHDTSEIHNPEGFSFLAFVREPEAREHRKRIIAASRFRRAIRPVPVLLFGVTTLRVTCNDTWERRKALKSRQRAILVDLEGRTPHQRQYFRKFRHFDTTGPWTKVACVLMARAVGHAERSYVHARGKPFNQGFRAEGV